MWPDKLSKSYTDSLSASRSDEKHLQLSGATAAAKQCGSTAQVGQPGGALPVSHLMFMCSVRGFLEEVGSYRGFL